MGPKKKEGGKKNKGKDADQQEEKPVKPEKGDQEGKGKKDADKKGKKKRKKEEEEAQEKEAPPEEEGQLLNKRLEFKQEPLALTAEDIRIILHSEPTGESPVDLSLVYERLIHIRIPPLEWYNFTSTPESLKLTNTSYSVVLTGTWLHGEIPYLTGGPLLEDYVFSQIHFHWGGIVQEDVPGKPNKNMWILSGSEHSVDDDQYPFEMHAVFRKRCCETHEAAKRVVDGIVIIAYLCADVTEEPNPNLEPVTKSIHEFFEPFTSVAVDTVPLGTILPIFSDDYLLYLGYMKYKCNHGIIWLITRQSFPISLYQLFKFQCVQNKHSHPITNPFRQVQSLDDRTMFLVNPSPHLESVIHFRDKDIPAIQDYWDEYSFDFKNTNFLDDNKEGGNEGDEGGGPVEKDAGDKQKKKGKKGKKK